VNVAKQQYAQWSPDKVAIIERGGREAIQGKDYSAVILPALFLIDDGAAGPMSIGNFH
jgi:hypothetical protein